MNNIIEELEEKLQECQDVPEHIRQHIIPHAKLESILQLLRAGEKNATQLKRAEKLADIAYERNLGNDGKVEIDGEWVGCMDLKLDFQEALSEYQTAKES